MKAKRAKNRSAAGKKRVYIVEDHPVLREGVMRAIDREPDLCVCGWSDSVAKAFSAISETKPDIALIDLTLPGRSGLELIKDLRSLDIATAMIVLSMHDEALFAERALRAGARGYLMKHEETSMILKAIRHVLKGGVFVSPEMSEHILRRISPHGAELKNPWRSSPTANLKCCICSDAA